MDEHASLDVQIRQAALSDVPAISQFIRPFVDSGHLLPSTPTELEELIDNAFLAMQRDTIVGCAALQVYSKKLAEIRTLAIAPAVQKRGVGKQLVNACVERAVAHQVMEIMAITSAEKFFHNCGFDFTLPGEKKALFLNTQSRL